MSGGFEQAGAYHSGVESNAPPVKMVALLYDRICESLGLALVAIENGSPSARHEAIAKASRILTALSAYIDFERGGQIAVNLHDIYRFCLSRLVNVDLDNDKAPIHDALSLLEPLRDSWHKLADQLDEVQSNDVEGASDVEARIAYGADGDKVVENRARATRIVI